MNFRSIPQASGIYAIVNSLDGMRYVGSAENMYERARDHFSVLRNNKHHNVRLQFAYDAHGVDAFVIEVIEVTAPCDLVAREQVWLDRYFRAGMAYNIAAAAVRSPLTDAQRDQLRTCKPGRVCADETKAKIAASLKGQSNGPFSDEHRARIADALRGKPKSDEHRAKFKAARAKQDPASLSHPHTDEYKARMSALAKQRPPFSPEHRAKIAAAATGRPRQPTTEETKQKISAARTGQKASAETRAKLSAIRKGRKHGPCPPETRAKIAAAHRARHAQK